MTEYVKKIELVTAIQYTGDNTYVVLDWADSGYEVFPNYPSKLAPYIEINGLILHPNQWLIKGITNEFFVWEDIDFRAVYVPFITTKPISFYMPMEQEEDKCTELPQP